MKHRKQRKCVSQSSVDSTDSIGQRGDDLAKLHGPAQNFFLGEGKRFARRRNHQERESSAQREELGEVRGRRVGGIKDNRIGSRVGHCVCGSLQRLEAQSVEAFFAQLGAQQGAEFPVAAHYKDCFHGIQ